MPKAHTGGGSGIEFQIPSLTDARNIETAFSTFADSIPAFPESQLDVTVITASTTAVVRSCYISTSDTAVTVTLPATAVDGDRVVAYQTGGGLITMSPGATPVGGGIPNSGSQLGAVSAVYISGKWYFTPFGYSGTLPTTSTGGTIVDVNGFRYHVFTAPGQGLFVSALANGTDIEVFAVGGGAGGQADSLTVAGQGGVGGTVTSWTAKEANYADIVTVTVGGVGELTKVSTSSGVVEAAGGSGTTATPTPGTAVDADLATAIGSVTVSGDGATDVGPVVGANPGTGGGGGYLRKASYPQQSYQYSYSTGGPYSYDCSYGARSYQGQTGTTTIQGDPCVNGACPPGWSCQVSGYYPPFGASYNCFTTVPTYETRYACDDGGNLSGTTCVRTCSGDNTQWYTETRWTPCDAGYREESRTCIDAKPTGGGVGRGGIAVIKYAIA
jgi:hypothetical protein